jgi:hypothetical protein
VPSAEPKAGFREAESEAATSPRGSGLTGGVSLWLLPSVTDMVFIGLLVGLCCTAASVKLLGDAGTGWHIRNGALILQTHTVPHSDPFSVSQVGEPWYAWEWLYDAGIAAIDHAAGLNGVVFFTAVVIALVFALTLKLMTRSGGTLLVSIPLLILAIAASSIHALARPHVLSWLFGVLWLAVGDSVYCGKSPFRLLWLPVLMLVWVNVHGGFLFGLAVLGIYFFGEIWERSRPSDVLADRLSRLGPIWLIFTGIICVLVGLANPYGYKLYQHIYAYLSNPFFMDHIEEFRSPDFHTAAPRCFAVLILITAFGLYAGAGKIRPAHLLLILFSIFSGLYASRNLPLASIVLVLVMAPPLSDALRDLSPRSAWTRLRSFSVRMDGMQTTLRGHLWATLVLVLGTWVCLHGGRLGSQTLMAAHFSDQRFPVKAVDAIQEMGIREPIFCPDNWGGYVIYRLYPTNRVFIDDRHDFYGQTFVKQYTEILHLAPTWNQVLDQWRVNWILIPRDTPLVQALREKHDWSPAYEDDVAVLFRRVTQNTQDSRLSASKVEPGETAIAYR